MDSLPLNQSLCPIGPGVWVTSTSLFLQVLGSSDEGSNQVITSGGSSNWRGLEVFSRIPQERGGQPKMLLAQCLLFLPSCLLFLARRLPLLLVCCFACSFFLRVRSSVGKESECSLASFGWTSRLPFLLSHASKLPNFLLLCCSYYPRWYAWSQRTRSS